MMLLSYVHACPQMASRKIQLQIQRCSWTKTRRRYL